MSRSAVERRLSDTHARLVRAREDLSVIDEQLAVVAEMADDTRIRALVSETPGDVREHSEAHRHAEAMVRQRRSLVDTISELEHRQNELLDRLVADPG